jgi:hypothetical protein
LKHHSLELKDFKPTPFTSSDMAAIIFIQKKFRIWRSKKLAREGNEGYVGEISDIQMLLKNAKSDQP